VNSIRIRDAAGASSSKLASMAIASIGVRKLLRPELGSSP
jgi:hypothetical protein